MSEESQVTNILATIMQYVNVKIELGNIGAEKQPTQEAAKVIQPVEVPGQTKKKNANKRGKNKNYKNKNKQ